METTRAILFDLDGTLIDSLGDIAGSLNHVLAELGLPTHPVERFKPWVGNGASELIARALPADRQELRAEVLARYRARYRSHLVVESRPYGGIEELLAALEGRGIRKAVITNKPHVAAQQIIQRLLGRFDWSAVIGQRDGVPHKPDPRGVNEILSQLELSPGECLYLGDTDTDMLTARNAGIDAVGCLWGFRDRAELEAHGARYLIAHPGELIDILDAR